MLSRLVQVVTVTVVRRTRQLRRGVTNLLRPARTAAGLVSAASLDALRRRSELMAENAFLRQQILVLPRAAPRRPRLHREDRLLLVLLARFDRAWRDALLVVQPDTLLRWHRDLFTLVWLNIAGENELSALTTQCLARRLGTLEELRREVTAWEAARNDASVFVNWRFTIDRARVKLNRVYPEIKS